MPSSNTSSRKRPSWDEYFLQLADSVSARGTCDRGYSGCVAVRDKRVLTTGYVGSVAGLPHCDEAGHDMHAMTDETGHSSQHCVRTLHAEQNALLQAARFGIPLEGATFYCRMEPCLTCAKMLANAGVVRVVCERRYHAGQQTRDLFKAVGIRLDVLHDEVQPYERT